MRSVAPMKTAKIGYIIVSLIMCVLGIILIIFPELSIAAVGIVCGVIFIAFGIIRLVGYFSKDLYRLAFQYDLAFGIMMIFLGAVMVWYPVGFMNFICIALGIAFLTDGLFKIQIAIDSRTFGIRGWWLILSFAVITVLFGALLIARPSESSVVLTILTGISMICEGALNIGTMATAVKIIKHQRPDVIDTIYKEREDQEK